MTTKALEQLDSIDRMISNMTCGPEDYPTEEIYAALRALDGISQDALDGGWTARGLSDYAKGLEAARATAEQCDPVVLTIEELDALTKQRLGNMNARYAEGFRRLMRTAIEENAEKAKSQRSAIESKDKT